jgi:hypothetical protein
LQQLLQTIGVKICDGADGQPLYCRKSLNNPQADRVSALLWLGWRTSLLAQYRDVIISLLAVSKTLRKSDIKAGVAEALAESGEVPDVYYSRIMRELATSEKGKQGSVRPQRPDDATGQECGC